MASIDDKNYEIFNILSSINLTLEEKNLKSQINRLTDCSKLYSVNNPARKLLKKNIASLNSIYSALDRVSKDRLQEDLNIVKESLNAIFEEFKLFTGITTVKTQVVEKKEKKLVKSFEDLDKLFNIEQPKYIEEVSIEEDIKDFLTRCQEYIQDQLEADPLDAYFIKTPLIVNAKTSNFKKFPRIGLMQRKTPYGILWLNQVVVAVKKDHQIDRQSILNGLYKIYGEKYTYIYEEPLRQRVFPEYKFFWFFPLRMFFELEDISVSSCALPLPRG